MNTYIFYTELGIPYARLEAPTDAEALEAFLEEWQLPSTGIEIKREGDGHYRIEGYHVKAVMRRQSKLVRWAERTGIALYTFPRRLIRAAKMLWSLVIATRRRRRLL